MAESVQGEGVKFNSSKSTAQAKFSTEKGTIHFTTDGEIFLNKTRYSGVKEIAIGTTIQTIGETGRVTLPAYPSTLPANGGNADTVDGKHASDFATAAQGTKADSAVQTIQINGTNQTKTNGVVNLPAYPTTLPASNTTDSYSATGTAPVSGKAVAAALGTLDVASQGGNGKFIVEISQTDGKINATEGTIDSSVTQNSSNPVTSGAVYTVIQNLLGTADALTYKGTLTPNSNKQIVTPAANKGDVYKVAASGIFCGTNVENGDMFICNTDNTPALVVNSNESTVSNNWDIIQKNIDGAVIGPSSSTAEHIVVFAGGNGKTIKDSNYTIGTSVPSGAVFTDTKVTSVDNHYTPSENTGSALNAGNASVTDITNGNGVQVITGIKRDAKGHVVGVVSAGLKSINTDTHDTNVAGTGISVSGTRGSKISLSQDTLETLACLTWD